MSVGHSEASFNHSCLKVPVDSLSRRPSPKYERLSSAKISREKEEIQDKKNYSISRLYNNFKSVKSYLEFYESIPDYSELHHLSNEEFYSRLNLLKITQKRFCDKSDVLDLVDVDEDINDKQFSYSSFGSQQNPQPNDNKRKDCSEICGCCCPQCSPNKYYCNSLKNFFDKKNDSKMAESGSVTVKQSPPKINIISDNDKVTDFFDPEFKKHSGYEADQESSNLQVGEKSSEKLRNYSSIVNGGDECLLGSYSRSRSLPISPGCGCEALDCGHRHSDIHFRNGGCPGRLGYDYCLSEKGKHSLIGKPKKIHSHPVPLTSRIPLYDKIMKEKEARRRIIHDRYSEELKSLVKPFSFTKREEQKERYRMFCSNPELTSLNPPLPHFKAKPIPKNLFSNYAYERMKEEEFYRALKKRIRAEEMLKSSSLPPSMASRERKFRSKSLDFLEYRSPKKSWNKCCGYKRACKNMRKEMELEEKGKCGTPQKRKLKSAWISNQSRRINSVTDSSTEISPYESVLERESRRKARPRSAFSTSTRNNLASVLRMETARKRLEKEMEDKLRENRLKDEARFKARLTRMTPAWRALSFDKDEDLALRVAARREEERLKKEKHQRLMESIYGRVYRMPPLFHTERFRSGSNFKIKSPSKDDINNFSYEDPIESQKPGEVGVDFQDTEKHSKSFDLPTSVSHREKCRSAESSDTIPNCEKGEKAKASESDDTM